MLARAQMGITTFGVQYKPILPIEGFGVETLKLKTDGYNSTIAPKLGHSFGMVVRHGLNRYFTFEWGINYVRRNYNWRNSNDTIPGTDLSDFGLVSYDLPVQLLLYVRFTDKLYMNVATGFAANFYASSIYTVSSQYAHLSRTRGIIQASYLANLGFELRTTNSGYFYLGTSLNRSMAPITETDLEFERPSKPVKFHRIKTQLIGHYLTLDLRYFFHEAPISKRKKKK